MSCVSSSGLVVGNDGCEVSDVVGVVVDGSGDVMCVAASV